MSQDWFHLTVKFFGDYKYRLWLFTNYWLFITICWINAKTISEYLRREKNEAKIAYAPVQYPSIGTKSYCEFRVWVISRLIDAICSPVQIRG